VSRAHGLLIALLLAGCGSTGDTPGGGPTPDDGSSPGDDASNAPDDGGAPDQAPASTVTTLRIHYPAGSHAMTLRGDTMPLSWTQGVALTASPDGTTFTYVFPDLPGAEVQFKPLLDDTTWSRGANYHAARGATVDVYPHFTTMNGQVINLLPNFHSTLLNNDRNVWAYLPPSYDENPLAHYPVLYMHDGQNLFDPALAFGGNDWKVENTLDAAYESDGSTVQTTREIIVIGPENTAQRIYEYTPVTDPGTPGGGGGDIYLNMLITELKPKVDAMLRTLPGRDTTGIMGSSLGGLISSYAGLKHPEVYGIVGALSPSTWWDSDWIVGQVTGSKGAMPQPSLVYVDCGADTMDDYADTQMLVAAYLGIGYVEPGSFFHVYQPNAMHNEVYWAQRFPAAVAFLFPPLN
jgi:predicted alpha/beta superfamily hydrolase